MNDDTSTSCAEDRRLELVLHKALIDVSNQSKKLTGKNKLSLQMEWLEFTSQDWDEQEVSWLEYFSEWER